MRVNAKTYPSYDTLNLPLKELRLPIHSDLKKQLDTELKSESDVESFLKGIKDIYGQVKHRYFITKPFEEAVAKSFPKIRFNYLKYDKPDAGVFFFDYGFTLYLINPPDKKIKASFFSFSKTALISFASIDLNGDDVTGMSASESEDEVANLSATTMALYYFINECEIDEVVVQPGKKHGKAGSPDNLMNETDQKITILDCKWFTNIIRDTPFLVNGHFRWQPCGPGRTKRKLIWISEFQKEGYHTHAKKQTE